MIFPDTYYPYPMGLPNFCYHLAIKKMAINGLDKKAMLMLNAYAKGAGDFQLLEVMSCKGGCIGGPCTIATQAKVINPIKNLVAESPKVKPAFGEEKKEEK